MPSRPKPPPSASPNPSPSATSAPRIIALHRHLFGDIDPWAGRYRTIRIAKSASMFCYPEHIAPEMTRLFAGLKAQHWLRDLSAAAFAEGAACFLSALNAIHPFRDGNGRTQLAFVTLLAFAAGHPFDLRHLAPEPFLDAMVESFQGREDKLARILRHLIAPAA